MATVMLDTRKLKFYAEQLERINGRIKRLDRRMDKLYLRIPMTELHHLIQADILTQYSIRLMQCQRYLRDTADDFEAVERQISKKELSDFYMPESAITWGGFDGIAGVLIGEHAETLSDWDSAGQLLGELERYYDTLSPEWHFVVESISNYFGITEAYNITSGIIQGNLTWEDIYDAGASIAGTNVTALAIVEVLNYTFTKGEELDQEMMDNIMGQIEEGDIIGAVGEGAEGFVDIIIGGSVDCMFGMGGTAVNNILGVIPGLNEGTEYITGLLTGGKYEATIGDMISDVGDFAFDAIDKTTDVITDVADDIRTGIYEGISNGVDAVSSWVGSWF